MSTPTPPEAGSSRETPGAPSRVWEDVARKMPRAKPSRYNERRARSAWNVLRDTVGVSVVVSVTIDKTLLDAGTSPSWTTRGLIYTPVVVASAFVVKYIHNRGALPEEGAEVEVEEAPTIPPVSQAVIKLALFGAVAALFALVAKVTYWAMMR